MKTQKKISLNKWNYPLKLCIALSLATVLLSACRKDDDPPTPDSAALNVVNATAGEATFNFALDNQIVNGPALIYTQQTGYLLAYSGERKFDATSGGTAQSVLTATIDLEKDKYYSLFINGLPTALGTLLTEDDLSAPTTGKAKIRFIQLSPDAGALTLNIEGGAALFTEQAYATASQFITIDPGDYTLEIRNSEGTVISEETGTITAGRIYTVWSGGTLAGTGDAAIGINVSVNN